MCGMHVFLRQMFYSKRLIYTKLYINFIHICKLGFIFLVLINRHLGLLPTCENLFFKRFYLFIFREGRRGRKREKHQYVVASVVPPHWGPGLQPRYVPWLGIEPATLWFIVLCLIHWATSARAWKKSCFCIDSSIYLLMHILWNSLERVIESFNVKSLNFTKNCQLSK